MPPRLITTSLAENIQLAFMCAPPSRCLDMSSRQLVLAINATNAIAIITSDSGSLPNTKRLTTSTSTPTAQGSVAVHQQDARHVPAFSRYVQPHKGQARTPPHRKNCPGILQSGQWTGRSDRQSFPPRTESALMPSNQRRVPDSCLAEAAENSAALDGIWICSDGFLKRGA
ncbi:Uncharacterised protein [Pasteurella multocida]|nr:Uncharacterised protein [Pasteurella multocida]